MKCWELGLQNIILKYEKVLKVNEVRKGNTRMPGSMKNEKGEPLTGKRSQLNGGLNVLQ